MNSKLDSLLNAIDPEVTIERTYERANAAINNFPYPGATVDQWDAFRICMAEFYRHIQGTVLNARTLQGDSDYLWSLCVGLLRSIYGRNGEKAAFEMARTGNEGGLPGVLRAVAMKMAEEYTDRGISARVTQFWNSLSVEEKFETMDEYLGKYGHLFPSELTEGSGARLKANFVGVLSHHPHMIKRLRSVGR